MVLRFADGRAFATGACPYLDWFSPERRETARIFISVSIGESQTQAMVDTGGVYFVCDPEVAELLDLDTPSLGNATLLIRGDRCEGSLHRHTVSIVAELGESFEQEVTLFVPRLAYGQEWHLPSILGLQGCLEFLRFAVDPATNTFYFGRLD
jgi:predicted aspartyl protease